MTRDQLLEIVRDTQIAFWSALSELEGELGVEIDGTQDLSDLTIDDLLEAGMEFGEEDEDDED